MMLPPFHLDHGGQLIRQRLERPRSSLRGDLELLLLLLLLNHVRELLLVVCLQVVSQGFGEPWQTFGWVVLAQMTLCNGAIKIVAKASPTLDAVSSEQHCSFGWEVWLLVKEINMY